jgi:hypothetical protein
MGRAIMNILLSSAAGRLGQALRRLMEEAR